MSNSRVEEIRHRLENNSGLEPTREDALYLLDQLDNAQALAGSDAMGFLSAIATERDDLRARKLAESEKARTQARVIESAMRKTIERLQGELAAEQKDHQLTVDTFRQQERIWDQKFKESETERERLVTRHNRNWLALQKLVKHPNTGQLPVSLEIEEMIALIPAEIDNARNQVLSDAIEQIINAPQPEGVSDFDHATNVLEQMKSEQSLQVKK